MIPLLCLPLARWFGRAPGEARRRLVISGLVLSIIVQLPGVLVDFSKVGHTPEIGYQTRDTRRWEWPFSAFVLNVPGRSGYGADERALPGRCRSATSGATSGRHG